MWIRRLSSFLVFTLRVWNKEEQGDKLIIESLVSIQDLDYLAPLEAVDMSSLSDLKTISPVEMELIRDNMSITAVEQIFNVRSSSLRSE